MGGVRASPEFWARADGQQAIAIRRHKLNKGNLPFCMRSQEI
jgi:hypothetical protein